MVKNRILYSFKAILQIPNFWCSQTPSRFGWPTGPMDYPGPHSLIDCMIQIVHSESALLSNINILFENSFCSLTLLCFMDNLFLLVKLTSKPFELLYLPPHTGQRVHSQSEIYTQIECRYCWAIQYYMMTAEQQLYYYWHRAATVYIIEI